MKKLALILMSLLMFVSLAVPALAADEGMTFPAENLYPLAKDVEKGPLTFEAVIRLPKGYAERAGMFVSSFGVDKTTSISLQFNSAKVLELYYELPTAKNVRHKFTDIPVTLVSTGEWVHIAVVKDDAAGQVHAYINGELVQTASNAPQAYGHDNPAEGVTPMPFCVGGDYRNGNTVNWKGEIREIALYADVRTADEIKADAVEIKADKDMQVWLQLEKGMTAAKDLSGNGNHMGDYVEPETTAAPTTAAQTSAAPSTGSSAATFDVAVVLAAAAAFAGAGVVVSKKRH